MNPSAPPAARAPAARPVVVLGEALVDEFPDGTRIAGGAPFNQARWLAAFGLPTTFITRIGESDLGARCVLTSARRCGMAETGIQRDPGWATGRVTVRLGPEGPSYRIEPESAWDHIDAAMARELTQRAAPAVVVFGSLAQRHAASREAIHAALGATSALRFADLNLREAPNLRELAEATLRLADWVKVNDDELRQLVAWFASDGTVPKDPAALEHAQRQLVQRFGVQRVIVTCGADGWYTLDAEGRRDARGPAAPVPRIVDTVGAGDAFSAVVVAGYAAHWPLAQSLAAAARLASAVCGERGAMPEQTHFIDHWRSELGFTEPPSRQRAGMIG